MRTLIFIVLLSCLTIACADKNKPMHTPIMVNIIKTDSGFQLLRGGKPYDIKGVGMGINDIASFAAHGGNSVRTWTTSNEHVNTMELLDTAHANGVTVALCLSLQAEHWGFDYNDQGKVAAQFASLREEVIRYRDHPALLTWIIGNELNYGFHNPKVYDAVNEVSKMIHELDPHHPTTTTLSGFDGEVVELVNFRAPDLDFLSFQVYGGLFSLPDKIAEFGYSRPFMVTEWGAMGFWEMEQTSWGAPIEMTSSEKADVFLRGYQQKLAPFKDQLIGSYAFLWGQKQERSPTWFGMFTENGEKTEVVDVMQYIWNGSWPENRAPHVNALLLNGKSAGQSIQLQSGETFSASFDVFDFENDSLRYHWEVKPESTATQTGGAHENPIQNIKGVIADPTAASIQISMPDSGAYRLFAYAYDDHGHAAHANIPFNVQQALTQTADDLLAGEVMAVAYSGFREGQHPDRGEGAINPSEEEILEDLNLLLAHDLKLIRLYDAGKNSESTLELIRQYNLPIKVLQGIWLKAEVSNHERCAWLDAPISAAELASNAEWNALELQRGIDLAHEYADIVVAVNVGNEALIEWTDHLVPLEQVITYVKRVKDSITQAVTVADNYDWWIREGASLAKEVDFMGVHSYAQWEGKSVEEALAYTIDNIENVRRALVDTPLAILEAGWATVASEFGEHASEAAQARYFEEIQQWATQVNMTVFFFEGFDEPWKGDPENTLGAEKHWGLFNIDRTPKLVFDER